ncbi:HFL125Wp [Eremothecium sinecaudum]|uniref:Cysteine protease RIM13 n=1 Tax=Eremothecium sinecaudum TaxID=45286 RepID=A0A0X8HTV3_9SACH|nr:HFL125Wp [Eremothecium sinecaudum]AMD21731.1 HFL125Wp [Eremothecium sinecaudum]
MERPLNDSEIDIWTELRNIYWSFYVKNTLDNARYEELVRDVQRNGSIDLIKALLIFDSSRKTCTYNDRFEWLTLKLNGREYPPIDINYAGQLCWNDPVEYVYSNTQKAKYDLIGKPAPNDVAEVSQHPMIDNCSMVTSLINVKTKNSMEPIVSYEYDLAQVNLYFNGAKRLVSIKNPVVRQNTDGEQLGIISPDFRDKLIEQAYFEVVQECTYNSKGSNTAIDTYRLCGWLPIVVNMDDTSFKEVQEYYCEGAMLALGTHINPIDSNPALRSKHDYIILNINDGIFHIRDPLLPEDLIRVDWEYVQSMFRYLYVNWDARKRCTFYEKLHFRYDTNVHNKFRSLMNKVIFDIKNASETEQTVYVWFERHLSIDRDVTSVSGIISPTGIHAEHEIGNNLGFLWLIVKVPPKNKTKIFYHTEKTTNCTLHLYCNSADVHVKKCNIQQVKTLALVEDTWFCGSRSEINYCSVFFQNPAYMFEVKSNTIDDIYVKLKLTWNSNFPAILLLYHYDDYRYSKPLMLESRTVSPLNLYCDVMLSTNTKYIVICKFSNFTIRVAYQLAILAAIDNAEIQLKRKYLAFGGLRFQVGKNFQIVGSHLSLPITISRPTNLHITISSVGQPFDFTYSLIEQESRPPLSEICEFVRLDNSFYILPMVFTYEKEVILRLYMRTKLNGSTISIEIGSDYKVSM